MSVAAIPVTVTRAFWLDGQVRVVGGRLEVSPALAAELVGANKAVYSKAEPVPDEPAAAAPAPEPSKPAPRRARANKEPNP